MSSGLVAPCDTAAAGCADRAATTHPTATLAATILGSSVAFIDGSVVNVALPILARDFRADALQISWAINAYLLPLGALMLLGGALGDHFGRRRLFLMGLIGFIAASVLCAVAPTLGAFFVGRALEGISAALLMPNSLAILGGAFVGAARGRAIGTWAAAGALAGSVGPILGGWLIDTVGWRSIFFLNLPIATAAAGLAWVYVAPAKPVPRSPLDWVGALLATASLGMLTLSLTQASDQSRASLLPWLTALIGSSLMLGFIEYERRHPDDAIMPLSMFSSRSFVGLTLLTFFLYGSLGGLLVLLPFFLIRIEHWTAVAAGAALLPVPVLIGLGSRIMGRVAGTLGGRLPLAIGSGLVAAGLALYARVGPDQFGYWADIFPATLAVALGMAVSVAPLTTSVMASVDVDHVGIASGFNSTVARIAGLLATALLGFVFARQATVIGFVASFRVAALIGSASAAMASVSALFLIDSVEGRTPSD